MKRTLVVLAASVAVAALPATAHARPCSDYNPVIVAGEQWVVYTGNSPQELENLSCSNARRMARRMIAHRTGTPGWKCRHTLQFKRCVRGGTYVDEYGFRQWRYLVGWHRAD